MNKLMTRASIFLSAGRPRNTAPCRSTFVFAAMTAATLLAGCATATIEDAVPQGALEQPAGSTEAANAEKAVSSGEPDKTGEYPNLNEVQHGEMAQMTPAEKQAYLAKLRVARAEQASGGASGTGPAAKQAELKRIARTHDDEVLKEIEAGSAD